MKRLLLAYLVLGSAVASAAEAPKVELKRQSTFNVGGGERNPFWPIGFKPAIKIASGSAEQAGPAIPASAFSVSSITLDPGARFAIINGKIMSEGQEFGLQLGSQVYQVTVKSIEDGRVVLLRRDEEIIVPLRRK
jgi:hypothetical protein